jgi:hypothetical protein
MLRSEIIELMENKDKSVMEIRFEDDDSPPLYLSVSCLVGNFGLICDFVQDNGVKQIELKTDRELFIGLYMLINHNTDALCNGKGLPDYYNKLFDMCNYLSLIDKKTVSNLLMETLLNDIISTSKCLAGMSDKLRPTFIREVIKTFYLKHDLMKDDYRMARLLLEHIKTGVFEHFPTFDIWYLLDKYVTPSRPNEGEGIVPSDYWQEKYTLTALSCKDVIFDEKGLPVLRINRHMKIWGDEGNDEAAKMSSIILV